VTLRAVTPDLAVHDIGRRLVASLAALLRGLCEQLMVEGGRLPVFRLVASPAGRSQIAMNVVGRRLVMARMDHGSVALGALAALSGVFFIVYGLTTLSFNTLRGAIPLGLICGMVLRCRAMQLTLARQYAGYLPEAQPNAEQWTPQFDESGGLIRPAF